MEQIEEYLAQLIKDPENDHINFELAFAYEKEKQYAAAISYYLRCAEYTSNNTFASECLIRCSLSINKQGGRDQKVCILRPSDGYNSEENYLTLKVGIDNYSYHRFFWRGISSTRNPR